MRFLESIKFTVEAGASALPLLVTRVGTNHPQYALAPNQLALAAHLLDRCLNFHLVSPFSRPPMETGLQPIWRGK
jgi:hypothetical protein